MMENGSTIILIVTRCPLHAKGKIVMSAGPCIRQTAKRLSLINN